MALNVYTNNLSGISQRHLGVSNNALAGSIEKLSSGLRINGAEDDASGMTISEKLRGQIRSMTEASMNAQDAISYLQTADGALEMISDMVHRMRELAVQAGNASYSANDRRELQKEVDSLKAEIDRTALTTEFNTQKLLSGSTSAVWSASTNEIEALMTGQPVAEGNYRLDFQVDPGKNAVYKTGVLVDEKTFDALRPPEPFNAIAHTTTASVNIPASDTLLAPAHLEIKDWNNDIRNDIRLEMSPEVETMFLNGVSDNTTAFQAIRFHVNKKDFEADAIPGNLLYKAYTYKSKVGSDLGTGGKINSGLQSFTAGAGFPASSTFILTPESGGKVSVKLYDLDDGSLRTTKEFLVSDLYSDSSTHQVITLDDGTQISLNEEAYLDLNAGNSIVTSTRLNSTYGVGSDTGFVAALYNDGSFINPEWIQTMKLTKDDTGSSAHFVGVHNGTFFQYTLRIDDTSGTDGYPAETVLFIRPVGNKTVHNPAYNITVEDQVARTDNLTKINDDGMAADAGVINIKASGDADMLYGAAVDFITHSAGYGQGKAELIDTYTTSDANSYLAAHGANVISSVNAAVSGYLEVTFNNGVTLDTDSTTITGTTFTFVNSETGERRTVQNLEGLGTSNVRTLDFGNGVTIDFDFRQALPPENVITAGDKMLFAITGKGSPTNTVYATLTLPDEAGTQVGPAVVVPNGRIAGTTMTMTAVKLTKDGAFETANLHWEVGNDGLSGSRFVLQAGSSGPNASDILRSIKLEDIPSFTNADNRMVLDNTQIITIYGNDREVDIALEGKDTLGDLLNKLSHALIDGLDMGADNILPYDMAKLITAAGTGNFSVLGTIVLQTATVGKQSELKFAGDENVLNALGFAQIQASRENEVFVTVTNAHTNAVIGSDIVNDRMLRGIIGGVDVKIDSRVGLNASLDQATGEMRFSANHGEMAYLHVVNRQTDVQVGANEGIKLNISIARVDTAALEIADLYLLTKDDAHKSITKLELALERVNRVRSQIGAQVNRMEDAMRNLATGGQNLLASESRIRDLDVAEESATFAKNQVLVNAAVAMLAQANQQPQMAMQLISGR